MPYLDAFLLIYTQNVDISIQYYFCYNLYIFFKYNVEIMRMILSRFSFNGIKYFEAYFLQATSINIII